MKAFTLVEIIIVSVIVAILVAFIVPDIRKMINRSYAQEAMHNLLAIYAAQQNYYQENGGDVVISGTPYHNFCYPGSKANACQSLANPNTCCSSLVDINSQLGINIFTTRSATTYACNSTSCTVTDPNFTLVVTLSNPINSANVTRYCGNSDNPCCSAPAGGTPGNECP